MFKNLLRQLKSTQRAFSNELLKNDILITGAVRSPSANYEKIKCSQLLQIVVDELVKRAKVPRHEIHEILLNTTSNETGLQQMAAQNANIKLAPTCIPTFNVDNVQNALAFTKAMSLLQRANGCCIILADVHERLKLVKSKTGTNGIFATEIVPVRLRDARRMIDIQMDELETTKELLGSSAVMLCGANAVRRLGLHPLARLIGYETSNEEEDAVQKVLRLGNLKHGDINTYAAMPGTTMSHMLTHLTHTLEPEAYGCAIIQSDKGNAAIAVLMQKSAAMKLQSDTLPQLTLYTKNPCPLCDDLVAELENNFHGEYQLQKVYIDCKQNLSYLRLYRHDIPVLFLNGEFLCMHRLNVKLLRHKLDLLKQQTVATEAVN